MLLPDKLARPSVRAHRATLRISLPSYLLTGCACWSSSPSSLLLRLLIPEEHISRAFCAIALLLVIVVLGLPSSESRPFCVDRIGTVSDSQSYVSCSTVNQSRPPFQHITAIHSNSAAKAIRFLLSQLLDKQPSRRHHQCKHPAVDILVSLQSSIEPGVALVTRKSLAILLWMSLAHPQLASVFSPQS